MVSVLYTYSALNMNAFEFYFLLHWLFCWIAPGFFFFFSPPQHILWNNKEQLSVKKKLLYFLNNGKTRNSSGGSEAATRLFEIWCVSPPPPSPAVRPALWGISAKWTWTNAVPRPATTALFARILLIATSATAGQVSHSPVFWSSQFALKTSQPESLLLFFSSWILHGRGANANTQPVVVSAECILPDLNHVHTPRLPSLDWRHYGLIYCLHNA